MNATLGVSAKEERQAHVAETAGLDTDRVRSVRLDIAHLLENGLLLDIDLHNFGCLKAGVTWKELGINAGDKRRDRIQKGQKLLVPSRYANKLKSFETRFRNSPDKYSFDVFALRPWIWIPLTAFDAWKEDWALLQEELAIFKAQLTADLPEINEQNTEYFKAVARRAWASYETPDDDSVIQTSDGKVYVGYEAFEHDIVTSALARVPNAADIDAISADYKTGFLLLPPEISKYYAEASAEAELTHAQARQARAEAELAEEATRKAHWEQIDRERSAAAKLEAIRKAEYDRAREQLAETVSPLQEVMLKFRDRIYQDVVDIAKSLQKNGTLVGKVGNKAKGLRELYDLLASCTNDTELRDALDTLDSALDTPGADGSAYNAGAIEEALAGVVAVTKDAAEDLRRQTSHKTVAGFLEL